MAVATQAAGALLLLPRDRQGLARRLLGPGGADAAWLAAAGAAPHGDALGVPRRELVAAVKKW